MAGSRVLQAVRLPDWQMRLASVMREHMARPFAWGSNDCVTFAAECVKAVTGSDRIEDVRSAWNDERKALRMLAERGGISAVVTDRLGPPLPSPLLARPGDVGVSDQGGREALCVCGGVNWHMPSEHGMATLTVDQILRAWRCEGV